MKIVTILGARPQFVKAATISRAAKSYNLVKEVIVHTGQHFDHSMSDVFFDEMEIPKPRYNLEVSGLNHGAMTGRMLEKIEEVLVSENPDWVLVYGDTNSTLAGAIAASKLHIPIAHVEAGLRSFNMKMPEEINRILTDKISTLLFCPTDSSVQNLKNEGITNGVIRTGDVMADALFYYQKSSANKAKVFQKTPKEHFVLSTIHRAENTDDPVRLSSIFSALDKINEKVQVILPIHPRTKGKLAQFNIATKITMLDPVGYFDMLQLLKNCSLVLTDSGGLQKEAYLCEKPCVTLRDETEWIELIEAGVNKIVGTNEANIVSAGLNFISNPPVFKEGLYGNGKAAHQIIESMLSF